jgi:hypothetical protein
VTTIKTTCRECGDIQLTTADIELRLEPSRREGVYAFTCPACGQEQDRPANDRVVSVLLATGVNFTVMHPDPLTEREITEFVIALDNPTAIDELLN